MLVWLKAELMAYQVFTDFFDVHCSDLLGVKEVVGVWVLPCFKCCLPHSRGASLEIEARWQGKVQVIFSTGTLETRVHFVLSESFDFAGFVKGMEGKDFF